MAFVWQWRWWCDGGDDGVLMRVMVMAMMVVAMIIVVKEMVVMVGDLVLVWRMVVVIAMADGFHF